MAPVYQAWISWLYAFGGVYLVAFFVYFQRFRRAERHARSSGGAAVARYNRMLRGFPNSFYAKMLGKRPLDAARVGAGKP